MASTRTPCCTDVHAHLFPLGLPDLSSTTGGSSIPWLERRGSRAAIYRDGRLYRKVDASYWDVEPRLRWMDSMGIDRQIVSPLPVLLTYSAPPLVARHHASRQNEAIAGFVAQAPARLVGFGTVPLQDPELAIRELETVRALGLSGVEIGTRAGDAELDAPEVLPFFLAAAELGIPLLLHAQEGAGLGRMDDPLVRFGVGVPADTSIALAHLFLGGVLAQAHGLRLCVCHGGGAFFWSLPRLRRMVAHSLGDGTDGKLVDAIGKVYVDTASMGPGNLDYLLDLLPADRLLLGSDYPATQADSPLHALSSPHFDSIRQAVVADNVDGFLASG